MLRMKWFRDNFLKENCSILDVGSMDINGSYYDLFKEFNYVGLDIKDGKNVDIVVKDPYKWEEIKSGTFDVVISGQAFEHIEYFWITIKEMVRVLKPGGLLCIIAPRGFKEHRHPVDCWRFLEDGMIALAKYAKLQVIHCSTNKAPSIRDYEWFNERNADTMLIARKTKKPVSTIEFMDDKRSRFRKWINKFFYIFVYN